MNDTTDIQHASIDEIDSRFRNETFSQDEFTSLSLLGFCFRTVAAGTMDVGTEFVELERIDANGTRERVFFSHPEAFADASAFINAAEEVACTTLEERLGPWGTEWQRDEAERYGLIAA
jgi:hypothetical protein